MLSEYPASRSQADVLRELQAGRRILTDLFGTRALPVFAPPFHSFDDGFLPLLRPGGIAGISRKGPRAAPFTAQGVGQVNLHVTLPRWSAVPPSGTGDPYLTAAVDHLAGKRTGRYDPLEPTGLLTHHLFQDLQSYAFIARFIATVSNHRAARWLSATEVFSFVDRGPT